jgi:hypothetical protein
MQCFYHPESNSVTVCTKCSKPICKECNYTSETIPICPDCWNGVTTKEPVQRITKTVESDEKAFAPEEREPSSGEIENINILIGKMKLTEKEVEDFLNSCSEDN